MKMNTHPKETLADGINIGDIGSQLKGPHNPAKLINTDMLRSEFVFDVLDGCAFNCSGCYIPRRNSCTPDDILNAIQISDVVRKMGIACEEMFIGPTDIFTATNFDEIMEDPLMYELTSRFSLSTSSTLMSDTEVIKNRWNIIQQHIDNAPARDFELFVAFDLDAYLSNDTKYVERLTTNLQFFEKDTVVFIVNFSEHMLQDKRLIDIANKIHSEFNVPLRILPSFFRSPNSSLVERKSAAFKEMLLIQLHECELPEHLSFNMFDKYFGGEGFINLSYKDGQLYITPFLFEGIPQTHEVFKIEHPYTSDNVTLKLRDLVTRQYRYASETANCSDCVLLSSCIGRKVLAYMESRDLIYCIAPKDQIWDDDNYI